MGKFVLCLGFATTMNDVTTLEKEQNAPKFSAKDSQGNSYDLDGINALGKTVILYFYPKDDTPGCTTQACGFRDNMSLLDNADTVVLGVSKDNASSHDKFAAKYDLNFPLLLDEDLAIHNAYGTWREKKNYGRTYMGCVRSTFIINPEGILSHVMYNVKATGHVERVIELLNS